MKKSLIIILIILLLALSSCNFNTPDSFTGDINDRKFTHYRQSDGCFSQFIETYKGTYYLANSFVYFSSDGISEYLKLCSRPDCKHNNADCNAYVNSNSIAYYNGYIYYVSIYQGSYWLFKMNMDGTDHINVKELASIKERFTGFFEHGYLYFYKGLIGMQGNTDKFIYKTAVYDNGDAEVITDTSDIGEICMFYPQNEYLYFYVYTDEMMYSIYRYSTVKFRWEDPINIKSGPGNVFINTDKVFWYVNGEGFYEYTYETKRIEHVADSIDSGLYGVSYNDEYIYAFQYFETKYSSVSPMFYIFDRQYNLVDSVLIDIKMEDYFSSLYVTELEDIVLISTSILKRPPDYYLVKSEFGSGDITLRKNSN